MYKLTGEVMRPYKWFRTDLWVEEILEDIVEVWFFDLYGYWRTKLFLVLVTFEDKVVLRSWWYCIGWESWFFPQDFLC
jgi:hypothetical protein